MNSSKLTTLLAGLLAFSAFALLGWRGIEKSPKVKKFSDLPPENTRMAQRSSQRSAMQNIRSLADESQRLRAAMELARTLPVSEIQSWIEGGQFDSRGGFALTLFEKIAIERWAQEKPREFLVWFGENRTSKHKFSISHLLEDHPAALQEALEKIAEPHRKAGLLNSLAQENPKLALAELRRIMPISDKNLGHFSSFFYLIARDHSLALEAMVETLDGPAKIMVEKALISQRVRSDFNAVFDSLLDRPDGFKTFLGAENISQMIDQDELIARLPDFPAAWRDDLASNPRQLFYGTKRDVTKWLSLDWVASGFTDQQAAKLRESLFDYAVRTDPDHSLPLLAEQNFSDEKRKNLLRLSVSGARTPEQRNERLASLTSAEDREYLQTLFQDGSSPAILARPVRGADDLISALVSGPLNEPGGDISYQLREWKPEEKARLGEAFGDLEGDEKARFAGFAASARYVVGPALKGEAIRYLIENSESREAAGWTGYYANASIEKSSEHAIDLMASDPAAARSWVDSLPPSEERLCAVRNLVTNWRNFDPAAAQRWLASQPAADRVAIEALPKW